MSARCSECDALIVSGVANRVPVRRVGADPEYIAVDLADLVANGEIVCVRCSGLCPQCLRAESPHNTERGEPDTCDTCHYDKQIATCEREMLAAVERGCPEPDVQAWIELRAWFEEQSRVRPIGRRFDAVRLADERVQRFSGAGKIATRPKLPVCGAKYR